MQSAYARFRGDTGGGIAITFAVAACVLLGAVGAAFDYSRAAMTQTYLQRAADGTALLAAGNREKFASYTLSDAAATDYFKTTFNADKTQDLSVRIVFLVDRVQVFAKAAVPTTIANVLGYRTMPIGANAEALYDSRIEIALVLDNTGSMADSNKLSTLKSASHKFLARMEASARKPESVKIAIVPFDTDVNLGSMMSSPWVDRTKIGRWTTNPNTAGCIWDRRQPYDVQDTPPGGMIDTLYGADATRTSDCSIGPILPLTTDFTALNAAIDRMNAAGNTNLTIGLVWGLHVLTPSEPVANAAKLGTKGVTKYIIFMTDGMNTQNRDTTVPDMIDARTRQVCGNLRDAGIQVFTTRIIDGNADLLRSCATDATMYYDIQDVSQFDPVFNKIYVAITASRLSQ